MIERVEPCVVNAGDSGQGMTSGTIAGILIKDLITGKDNPWAEIYSPKRGAPTSSETVAGTGVRVWNTIEVIICSTLLVSL